MGGTAVIYQDTVRGQDSVRGQVEFDFKLAILGTLACGGLPGRLSRVMLRSDHDAD